MNHHNDSSADSTTTASETMSGENVAPTIDAAVTAESPNRHEDVPARTLLTDEAPAQSHSPRHAHSTTGAMCARADDAPTARDRLTHSAAEAARTTGKRTDLLRYLRLRRRSS